jgi:hypothetical protein
MAGRKNLENAKSSPIVLMILGWLEDGAPMRSLAERLLT